MLQIDLKLKPAYSRAMTYSFGSICFGSLIVALLDLLRAGVRILQAQASDSGDIIGSVVACCVQCCVTCIRGLVDYFNRYAYIEIVSHIALTHLKRKKS